MFSETLKAEVLAHLRTHREADQITKGSYWKEGKGCAVGCTLHSFALATGRTDFEFSRHRIYEEIFGPGGEIVGRLEDRIFEGLPNREAMAWPERFFATAYGRDLSMTWPKFALWLLSDVLPPQPVVAVVADLYREWCAGTKPSVERWRAAREAAIAAADAATPADADAANAARAAAATYGANAAAAATYAVYAVQSSCYVRMADKLIQIIASSP
jgi:hypothetical protein